MGQGLSSAVDDGKTSKWEWKGDGGNLTLALPDECLSSVFAKLGCHDRNACSLVCKRWNFVDSKTRQRLVLVARSDLSPVLSGLLSRFDSVSVLSLKCSRKLVSIDDEGLTQIGRSLKLLKKLKLKGCVDITDNGLCAFSLLSPSLSKLSCASCSFGAKGLNAVLANCARLQDLTLKRLRKLDAQNTLLGEFEINDFNEGNVAQKKKDCERGLYGGSDGNLERLCLKDLHNARLFAPLFRSSKGLKTLIVCRSSGNWDLVLENLGSSLVEIQMENMQLTDAGLFAISASCVGLEVLYVSRVSDCTDAGFSAVAGSCRKLRKLHIDACSKFGNRNFVGDEGIMAMATKCSQLQEVVLMGVPISVVSLNALALNCAVLERMALCNTESIGDSEMGFVAAKFSSLKKLCVKNCPVSDAGIEALAAGCPNLVKLKVKRCRGVTQETVCRLRLHRKSLVVSVDAGSIALEEEEMAGEEEAAAGLNEGHQNYRRRPTTSTRTHVVCGSRSASLLRSKFTTGMLLRRPSFPSASRASASHR